jgi:phosphoribulokinase
MSPRHPVIAITGSSGAGTTTVTTTFQQIFRREAVKAVIVYGDAFHRYNRDDMRAKMFEAQSKGEMHFSHFGPEANLFEELETLFRVYGESGKGRARKYLHEEEEAAPYQQKAGTFTPWEDIPSDTDMLFYEGLHGAIVTEKINVAQYVDLLIGVVPVINLEWIQKLHRDKMVRGYTQEAVVDTILRRMPDYINYICPQFSETHVNFQRVPTVDTSNPFIARDVPSPDESMLIIRFKDPRGIDFPYLLSMLPASFMSRPNTIVCPGSKMPLAMQLIFTPMIWQLCTLAGQYRAQAPPLADQVLDQWRGYRHGRRAVGPHGKFHRQFFQMLPLFCPEPVRPSAPAMSVWRFRMTMKKVEVEFSEAGNEIVVVVDGLRIAKRGRPGTPHAKTWVLLEPGWTVRGVWEGGEYAIEIEHNGVRIH